MVSVFFTAVSVPSALPGRRRSRSPTLMHVGQVDIGERNRPTVGQIPTGVTSSVTPPVTSTAATIGASFVPVMVTSICRVMIPPC